MAESVLIAQVWEGQGQDHAMATERLMVMIIILSEEAKYARHYHGVTQWKRQLTSKMRIRDFDGAVLRFGC